MVTGPEKWQCNNCVIGMWGLRSERRNMVMKLENGERYTPPELRRIYQEWESTCQGNVNKRENSLRFLSSKYNIVHVLSRSVEQFTNVRKTNLRLFPAMQKICITECILIILVLKVHDLSRRLNFLLAYNNVRYPQTRETIFFLSGLFVRCTAKKNTRKEGGDTQRDP